MPIEGICSYASAGQKADVLVGLARSHLDQADLMLAEQLAARGLELGTGAPAGARALMVLARVRSLGGDPDAADALCERADCPVLERAAMRLDWGDVAGAVELLPERADRRPIASAALGELLLATRQWGRCRATGLLLSRAADLVEHVQGLLLLARIALLGRRPREALALVTRARASAAGLAGRGARTRAVLDLVAGEVARMLGRPARARRAALLALARAQRAGDRPVQARALLAMARLGAAVHDDQATRSAAEGVLALVRPGQRSPVRAEALGLAAAAAARIATLPETLRDARRDARVTAELLLDEAAAALEALHVSARSWTIERLHAGMQLEWGEPAPARELLRRCGAVPPCGTGAGEALELATLAVRAGRPRDALVALAAAPERERAAPAARVIEALSLRASGLPRDALAVIDAQGPPAGEPTFVRVLLGRVRECLCVELGMRRPARAARDEWLEAARAQPERALAVLARFGLTGPRHLALRTGARTTLLSDVEAAVILPPPDVDVMFDATVDVLHGPDGALHVGGHSVLRAAILMLIRRCGQPALDRVGFYYALWGDRAVYDFELHEQKLLKTLHRLRQLFGRSADGRSVLHASVEQGIGLRADLRVALLEPVEDPPDASLSTRQRRVLRELESGDATAADLLPACGTTRAQLLDDLLELIARGLVRRLGHGRGTRYALTAPTAEASKEGAA